MKAQMKAQMKDLYLHLVNMCGMCKKVVGEKLSELQFLKTLDTQKMHGL